MLEYQSRFGQIAEDYEYLKLNKIKYEKFYDLYGHKLINSQKQSKVDFSPPPRILNSGIPESAMKKSKMNATTPIQSAFGSVELYRQSYEPIPLGGKRAKKMESSITETRIININNN